MLRLSAITLSTLAAMAAQTASAEGLAIIGSVDTGLTFQSVDSGVGDRENSLSMNGANYRNNRVIFLGDEQISATTKAGFWLEMGFQSDTGDFDTNSSIFSRGAWVYLSDTNYGTINMGRIGSMRSSATPICSDVMGNRISPFGADWPALNWPMFAMPFVGYSLSNMVHYTSPKFGNFQVNAQYSFSGDDTGDEGTSSANRYSALALTYDGTQYAWVVSADWMNASTRTSNPEASHKDAFSVTVGGNIDFQSFKTFAWAQYFKDWDQIMSLPGFSETNILRGRDQIGGYALSLGVTIPAWGGKFQVAGMYMDAEADDEVTATEAAQTDTELQRLGLLAAYEYPLSKRTTLYGITGYWRDSADTKVGTTEYKDPNVFLATVGINHLF